MYVRITRTTYVPSGEYKSPVSRIGKVIEFTEAKNVSSPLSVGNTLKEGRYFLAIISCIDTYGTSSTDFYIT